jgi:hypothetical protein
MEKLSTSHTSEKYLEEKYHIKATPISKEFKEKLSDANKKACENIKHNNLMYMQSNAHSSEHILSRTLTKKN